mgnify:CR=1 FL=1
MLQILQQLEIIENLKIVREIVVKKYTADFKSRKTNSYDIYLTYDFGKTFCKMGWWEKPIT